MCLLHAAQERTAIPLAFAGQRIALRAHPAHIVLTRVCRNQLDPAILDTTAWKVPAVQRLRMHLPRCHRILLHLEHCVLRVDTARKDQANLRLVQPVPSVMLQVLLIQAFADLVQADLIAKVLASHTQVAHAILDFTVLAVRRPPRHIQPQKVHTRMEVILIQSHALLEHSITCSAARLASRAQQVAIAMTQEWSNQLFVLRDSIALKGLMSRRHAHAERTAIRKACGMRLNAAIATPDSSATMSVLRAPLECATTGTIAQAVPFSATLVQTR